MSRKDRRQSREAAQPIEVAAVPLPEVESIVDKPQSAEAEPQKSAADGLSVRSVGQSFRRCGREFSPVATVIPIGQLAPREVIALTSEPHLVTEFVNL